MSDKKEKPDQEPLVSAVEPQNEYKADSGSPLSGISRMITDKELEESSGARKLLLYAYDKLEKESKDLQAVKEQYHLAMEKMAAKDERLRTYKKLCDAEDMCKIVGSAVIGFAANNVSALQWCAVALLGIVLVAYPFYSNYRRNKEDVL